MSTRTWVQDPTPGATPERPHVYHLEVDGRPVTAIAQSPFENFRRQAYSRFGEHRVTDIIEEARRG